MDLLSDILLQAGLKGRVLDLRHLEAPVWLQFPCERSIGFHVVTAGHVYLHGGSLEQPVRLQTGDAALMARGQDHVVSTEARLKRGQLRRVTSRWGEAGQGAPAEQPVASVVSGAYQLWNAPVHPLFRELPDWYVVRAEQRPRLNPMGLAIALLGEEASKPDLGSETLVHGLLDVIFTYLLREIVVHRGLSGASFCQAIQDTQVRQVVERMHQDCAHPWTLEDLARSAGLSRTGLAERFRASMGDTPLSYLRSVRMQRAMRLLSESEATLEAVAAEVGYQDAFSFSRVFKKTVGVPPRDFRRQDAADRASPWRVP
ncbi:MAG: AraC family transcriptional regulator [Polyangiaceae bacterium]|jgi:AraC-like DNA-binding protein|nr:AraC family transcriptional regulator [Polyangiaceae bacterium]